MLPTLLEQMGVSDISPTDLRKFLAGKTVICILLISMIMKKELKEAAV